MIGRGENPYLTGISRDVDLPFSVLTPLQSLRAEYGPVWLAVCAGLARLAGNTVGGAALAYRGLAAACHVGMAWLAYLLARRRGGAAERAFLLCGWNPLLLVELAGSGHNDALMAFLALLGIYWAESGRRVPAWIAFLLSMLVKYLTGLLVALYGAAWLARARRQGRLGRESATLVFSAAAVLVVAYLPFAEGIGDVRALLPGFHLAANPNANLLHAVLRWALTSPAGDASAWQMFR